MKILFMNMLPDAATYGHKLVDQKILHALNQFSDLHIITPLGWFDVENENVTGKVVQSSEGKTKISYYKTCLKYLFSAYNSDLKEKFDKIIFATFDEHAMMIANKIFRNAHERVYIIYRNNIDEIDRNKRKCASFEKYCSNINHIVFEDFQKEHLMRKYNIPLGKIFVLPYPKRDKINKPRGDIGHYDFIAISNSNNEDWISKLIDEEKEKEIIKRNNLQVVFRSKKYTFDDGFLHVIKGYIEPDSYNNYLYSCSSMFIPYPSSFKYRMSGVMIEAFSNHKFIVGSNIPLLQSYSKKYPNICKTVENFDDLLAQLSTPMYENDKSLGDFEKFEKDHSEEVMKKALKKMLTA